jgi:hypothetical protein
MKVGLFSVLTTTAIVGLAGAASGQTWLFSTDLGSNLDLSDPVTPANNFMDCGDIYTPTGTGIPLLYKDDTGPTAWWTGYPFGVAPQPLPPQVPTNPNAPEFEVLLGYAQYFDLDAEDQLDVEIFGFTTFDPADRALLATQGLYFRPSEVFISFEDDLAPGWYRSGNVPTTSPPDNPIEVYVGPLLLPPPVPPPPAQPVTFAPLIAEPQFDLELAPGTIDHDDDVDALDLKLGVDNFDPFQFRYWSPDHEANLGLDPGSIYLTFNGGGPNFILALDQMMNFGLFDDPTTPGIIEDADIDAFEFITIDSLGYELLFGLDPGTTDDILLGLFSVDDDDPDTPTIDESGGLLPHVIYASDLAGTSSTSSTTSRCRTLMRSPSSRRPAPLTLLALGGLITRRRR